MEKILIIGASGLVGNNCHRYFSSKEELKVIGTYFTYQTEGTVFFDTLNPKNADNFDIHKFNPDVIVHTGALTWVDYCEEHQQESFQKTVVSTKNVIQLCQELDARMVFISTDYIFGGKKGPYLEDTRTQPLSIYGKHKLEAELLVRSEINDHLILRITNVYGDEERNKNFIARLLVEFKEGKKLELGLPYDQYSTPINAWDIGRAMYLLLKDHKQGIYHIASTDYLNRVQLAQRVLKYFPENDSKIIPLKTEDIDPPAERPLMGGLKAYKFLAEYPDFVFSNVDDYLRTQKLEV